MLLQKPQLFTEPGIFGFRRPAGSSFRLPRGGFRPPGILRFLVRQQPLPPCRVIQPQLTPRQHADFQPKHPAVSPLYALGVGNRRLLPVDAVSVQPRQHQSRRKVAPGGVKADILRNPHRRVDAPLDGNVPPPSAPRRYLHHKIRRPAFPPHQPGIPAVIAGGPKDGEHIRRHPHIRAVHPVIDQHIAGDINIVPVTVAHAQGGNGVREWNILLVRFGHWFTVRRWVVDGEVVNFAVAAEEMPNRRFCRFSYHKSCSRWENTLTTTPEGQASPLNADWFSRRIT